jgi:AAA domain
MAKPILLLSGIPGTGKSSFARWLAKNKGYIHVDFDHGGLQQHELETSFRLVESSEAQLFIAELLRRKEPICLDWGFPPRCLWIVRRLIDGGVEPWWFDADPEIAKKHFLSRCDVPEAAFDEQIANIKTSRGAIMELFGDRVISALNADGTHVSCEQIYAQILK